MLCLSRRLPGMTFAWLLVRIVNAYGYSTVVTSKDTHLYVNMRGGEK